MHHLADQLSQDYLPDGWERVASSAFTRVAHHRERQLYFKEFLPRSPAETFKALLHGSRAARARANAEVLLRWGFDTPGNILLGRLPGRSHYLFTTAAPGEDIRQWLARTQSSREHLTTRWQLLRELGTYIGRLHASGFIHDDLRVSNIMADLQPDRFRFTLLDNERNRRKDPPSGRMLLRNLMQLNMLPLAQLSRSDRMRFFRAWHRQMRELSKAEGRILAVEAYRWAMRRMDSKNPL